MTDTPPQPARTHQIELPTEHVVGVPADYASVWHTPESFVLVSSRETVPGPRKTRPHGQV